MIHHVLIPNVRCKMQIAILRKNIYHMAAQDEIIKLDERLFPSWEVKVAGTNCEFKALAINRNFHK